MEVPDLIPVRMFCDEGVLYFVASRRRVAVPFTAELRARTLDPARQMRDARAAPDASAPPYAGATATVRMQSTSRRQTTRRRSSMLW